MENLLFEGFRPRKIHDNKEYRFTEDGFEVRDLPSFEINKPATERMNTIYRKHVSYEISFIVDHFMGLKELAGAGNTGTLSIWDLTDLQQIWGIWGLPGVQNFTIFQDYIYFTYNEFIFASQLSAAIAHPVVDHLSNIEISDKYLWHYTKKEEKNLRRNERKSIWEKNNLKRYAFENAEKIGFIHGYNNNLYVENDRQLHVLSQDLLFRKTLKLYPLRFFDAGFYEKYIAIYKYDKIIQVIDLEKEQVTLRLNVNENRTPASTQDYRPPLNIYKNILYAKTVDYCIIRIDLETGIEMH